PSLSLRLPLAHRIALPLDRAVADVTPVLHATPVDGIREYVGGALCLAHGIAEPHGAEHAPAVRDHAPLFIEARATVENLAGQLRRLVEPFDDVALAHGIGIAACRHHDAERCARIPLRLHLIQPAFQRGFTELGEIGLQAHHD